MSKVQGRGENRMSNPLSLWSAAAARREMAQQRTGTTTLLQDAGSTTMNFLQDPLPLPTQT